MLLRTVRSPVISANGCVLCSTSHEGQTGWPRFSPRVSPFRAPSAGMSRGGEGAGSARLHGNGDRVSEAPRAPAFQEEGKKRRTDRIDSSTSRLGLFEPPARRRVRPRPIRNNLLQARPRRGKRLIHQARDFGPVAGPSRLCPMCSAAKKGWGATRGTVG